MAQPYTNLKKLSDKNGEIEFQAEIPAETLEEYMLHELARYAAEFAMPGFRKGKVPHDVVRKHVGEMELLESAADEAVRDAMVAIAEGESVNPLGRPQLTVTKIAPQNPLEFKLRFAKMPEISLPDYRKIGKAVSEIKEELGVDDKEIDEAVNRIRTMIANATGAGNGGTEEGKAPELAPLTDEDVKKFGPFNTVADFRAEIKRNLEQEKQLLAKDRKREEMVKQIVGAAKFKVPEMLVEQELHEFIHDRDQQIAAAGLSLEEYLKQAGKTAEALEKEERHLIEEDIKTSLVIQEIRKKESLEPDTRDVQTAIMRLKLRYPDREETALRRTAEAMVMQEKLFSILEGAPAAATAPEKQEETA